MRRPSSSFREEALKQRLYSIKAFFRTLHGHHELEHSGAFEFVAFGLALDQLDQRQRVDRSLRRELDSTALRATVDFLDAQLFGLQFQQRDPHQVLGGLWQQAETVDHLHLQVFEAFLVRGRGDAFVENQSRMNVRQVVLGNQRRYPQIDFRTTAQRLIEVRLFALADRLHRALEHFHVQREADGLDLPALAVAQQFAGATDFQVVGREHEARAEVLGVGDRFQTLFRIRGDLLARRRQQVRVSLVMTATDPAAQLVQLRQAKLVGTLDDDGVGAGHVDAGLDDGRGDQHVEALVVEVAHHLFEFAFAHLPVADADPSFRHQFGEVGGAFLDGLHVVVQVVNLAATQQFTEQGFLDRAFVLLHDEGPHRQATGRRRSDDRQVAHARHRHVQRARNRRGSQREDVDFTAQGLELFFLTDTEAVLFVDDHLPEVFYLHIVGQQFVGADNNVDLAFGQISDGGIHFLGRLETAHHFHAHRPVGEAVAEAVVVLLGEQGGRHQNRHLATAVHGDERSTHRYFGLAETDVAADQSVHRFGREHVGAYGVDGGLLIRGFFERETGAEGRVIGFRVSEGMTFTGGAAGVDVEQLGGHVTHLFGSFALGLLPGLGAEAVQRGQRIVAAGVSGDQVQVGNRHVQLGAFGVLQSQEFGNLVVDFQSRQTQITADTVVYVHHRRAFAQLGEVLDHCIVVAVGTLFPATTLHHPLTEQRAFGDQRQRRVIQHQAFVQRRNGDRQAILARDKVRPAVDGFRSQLQAFEQFQQHFTTARRLGGKQHATGELVEETRQRRQWLGGLGFDGQVRQQLRRETFAADAGFHILLTGHHARPVLQAREAVLHRQEQLGRWQ